jgi:hypothetical protein
MPIPQTFHGTVYQIPVQGDLHWAPPLTRYLVALGTYSISSTGGTYTLTGDLNLGNAFGVFAKYFTSGSALPSTAGSIRLANLDTIDWRNFANSGNLPLAVNSSDQLTFNGSPIQPLLSLTDGEIWIGDGTNTPVGRTLTGDVTVNDTGVTAIGALKITNAMVSNSAAIAYGKLALTGSIVNNDIYSSAAIAYSKLALPNSIVNADIATAAAIAYSKLAALTASRVLVSDGSGFVSASSITNTTLGFLDATSSIQSQINGKEASFSGLTTDGVIYATSATAEASTAAGTTGQFLQANTGSAPTWGTPSGSGVVNSGTQYQLAYYATSTTAVSGLTLITANRALESDANGLPVASAVTSTILGYLDATSSIQTQLNAKQATLTAGQLPGTATNNNAPAGDVGEYVESIFTGTSFPATGNFGDATSISLTAGDWDVTMMLLYNPGSATTATTDWSMGVSQTSGNSTTGLVLGSNYWSSLNPPVNAAVNEGAATIASYRQSLSGTTTIYAKFSAHYTSTTPTAYGRLSARRMR